MRFGILGPLQVRAGNAAIDVPGARARVLLAALLLRTGQAVPADTLAEMVWDGSPPGGAAATLRSHVMRLRRVLGPQAGSRLVTRYPGYLVEADAEEVDLLCFTAKCREGRAAAQNAEWERAAALLAEALELWRGEPLADIPSQTLQREEVPRLEHARLQALEWRADADLHLGRHDEMVPGLRELTAGYPFRERFHAQLMLALYRCGRQHEALAVYQAARRILVGELGSEPGPELRRMHQQILHGDPRLAAPEPVVALPAVGRVVVVPRELPRPVGHFTGRTRELAALTALLDRAGDGLATSVVISAIDGTAGVGKTALAVQWAHQTADWFPDGQLYVNLRGYDPDQPARAGDVLAGFLRSLGLPSQDIPPEADERAVRYRSMLAGRKMLILLDNAADAGQVRLLLPGTPGCMTVVTSRDALTGLVTRDGAARLDLDLLPLADSIGLLRELVGVRVDDDHHAAEALAKVCCQLPLALRGAAELAAARPAVTLASLVAELSDQQRRLDLLDAGGDPRTAVRAVFSWSYEHLDADTARSFRLAGLHPGPELDRCTLAALSATTAEQADHMLGVLARGHLIQLARPGRYGMHDLLRGYARSLAAVQDGPDEQRAALTGLFDYYLHAAVAAVGIAFPAERHRLPQVPPPQVKNPVPADEAAALAWLDAERGTLVALTEPMAEHGWPWHATSMSAVLFRYLETGFYPEALTVHGNARRAARQVGDLAAEGNALNNLGVIELRQGRYQRAADHLEQALIVLGGTDGTGQARALSNLGFIEFIQGHCRPARGHLQRALTLWRQFGDRAGEARTLASLGTIDLREGRYESATRHLQRSLALCGKTGDRGCEARVLGLLGEADLRRDRYQQAAGHLQQALALFRDLSDQISETDILVTLGLTCLRLGDYAQADGYLTEALALCGETGDLSSQASTFNALGELLLATERFAAARARYGAGLDAATRAGDEYEKARAHDGLARACQASDAPGCARHHWQEALAIYNALGAPEAEQVRTQIEVTGDGRGKP